MNRTRTLLTATAAALALVACSSGTETANTAPTLTTVPPSPEASAAPTPSAAVSSAPAADGSPITMTVDGQTITASLNDSQVSQDLLEMLPVTLSWFRQGSIEYITELDAPLTETGPFYTDVQPGDIVYYNPADSFTIIYEETSSVPTLTKMGEITSGLDVFAGLPDDITMTIERG